MRHLFTFLLSTFAISAFADPLLSFDAARLTTFSGNSTQTRDTYGWHFQNTGQPSKTYFNGVYSSELPATLDSGTRIAMLGNVDCSQVIVGVLDTGCNTNHPDLTGVVWTNSATGLQDQSGHGTRMCGLIAARANDIGSRGVAVGCKLAVARISLLTPAQISTAMTNLLDFGAKVICFSWGMPRHEAVVYEAFAEAHRRGVIVACAAINSQVNYDNPYEDYPIRWKTQFNNLVVVGCEMPDGRNLPGAAATGTNWVDFIAPGWALPTPDLGTNYWYANGTSEATAVTTGVVALLMAQHPNENYRSIISRMRYATHYSSDPQAQATISRGCLDAYAASVMQFPSISVANDLVSVQPVIVDKPYILRTSQNLWSWTEIPFIATNVIHSFPIGGGQFGFYGLKLAL